MGFLRILSFVVFIVTTIHVVDGFVAKQNSAREPTLKAGEKVSQIASDSKTTSHIKSAQKSISSQTSKQEALVLKNSPYRYGSDLEAKPNATDSIRDERNQRKTVQTSEHQASSSDNMKPTKRALIDHSRTRPMFTKARWNGRKTNRLLRHGENQTPQKTRNGGQLQRRVLNLKQRHLNSRVHSSRHRPNQEQSQDNLNEFQIKRANRAQTKQASRTMGPYTVFSAAESIIRRQAKIPQNNRKEEQRLQGDARFSQSSQSSESSQQKKSERTNRNKMSFPPNIFTTAEALLRQQNERLRLQAEQSHRLGNNLNSSQSTQSSKSELPHRKEGKKSFPQRIFAAAEDLINNQKKRLRASIKEGSTKADQKGRRTESSKPQDIHGHKDYLKRLFAAAEGLIKSQRKTRVKTKPSQHQRKTMTEAYSFQQNTPPGETRQTEAKSTLPQYLKSIFAVSKAIVNKHKQTDGNNKLPQSNTVSKQNAAQPAQNRNKSSAKKTQGNRDVTSKTDGPNTGKSSSSSSSFKNIQTASPIQSTNRKPLQSGRKTQIQSSSNRSARKNLTRLHSETESKKQVPAETDIQNQVQDRTSPLRQQRDNQRTAKFSPKIEQLHENRLRVPASLGNRNPEVRKTSAVRAKRLQFNGHRFADRPERSKASELQRERTPSRSTRNQARSWRKDRYVPDDTRPALQNSIQNSQRVYWTDQLSYSQYVRHATPSVYLPYQTPTAATPRTPLWGNHNNGWGEDGYETFDSDVLKPWWTYEEFDGSKEAEIDFF